MLTEVLEPNLNNLRAGRKIHSCSSFTAHLETYLPNTFTLTAIVWKLFEMNKMWKAERERRASGHHRAVKGNLRRL